MRIRTLISIAATALALCACAPPTDPSVHLLTYASPYPPSHPFSQADQEWMDRVERASDGRLAFHAYWSGGLLSSDMSMLEIRHGLADIGLITPIYAKGGTHLLRTQSGFYGGVQSINDQVAVYHCLATAYPGFGAEVEGLQILAVQGGNFPGVLTVHQPISQLSDFKGLRLRAPNELVDLLQRLGADPINMPMGEVYSALAKGIIDGVVAPADTIVSLHFHEVAKYFTDIHFSRGAYPARAISNASWQQLPPDLQALLAESRPWWEDALNRELLKAEAAGEAFGKANGIRFIPFPLDEQHQFDRLYNEEALAQARRLQTLGIDGEPVFRSAQAMIAAGTPIYCEGENAP